MNCCPRCFERYCDCNAGSIDIDYYMYPAIYELNRKGYRTQYCCSGHADEDFIHTYILFSAAVEAEIDSEYFGFDSYRYRGLHVKRNKIHVKRPVAELFKKKSTDKEALIQNVNREIYHWAQALPIKALSPVMEEKAFPDDYFEAEVVQGDTKPWLWLRPGLTRGEVAISDYEAAVSVRKGMSPVNTCILAGANSQFMRYRSGLRQSPFESLKEVLRFPVRMAAFGMSREIHMDAVSLNECFWQVTYTHADADHEIDSYELEDYREEHPNADALSAFRKVFDDLTKGGCYICLFSSGENIILFTNKMPFAYHVGADYTAFLIGDMDYSCTEMRHVQPGKEMFVFANGALLFSEVLV